MGEIKSTLDIALERLKSIGISEEEKEEIKRKEINQKALSLSNRYIEGTLSLHDVQKEIERLDDNTKRIIRNILLSRLIEELSLKENYVRILQAIGWILEKDVSDLIERFQNLITQYEEEKNKIKEKVENRLIKSLYEIKLKGSAIEVNIESSNLWREEIDKLDKSIESRIKKMREELKGLTQMK